MNNTVYLKPMEKVLRQTHNGIVVNQKGNDSLSFFCLLSEENLKND